MRIYLEAFDAAGNRLGDGPIVTLTAAQVTRLLDGVGTIQFETPATDERALDILVPRVRFRLYSDNNGVVREVGRGIVLRRELRENEGGAVFVYECADSLVELKNYTVHVGRIYSQQTITDLVNDLIGLVPGWSADVQPDVASMVVDARFDGVSVLDALLELCENTGIHMRLAAVGNVVEVGGFGADSGVLALNAETASSELYNRAGVTLVQALTAGDDSEDLVNWIVPLGAGEDAAAVTLKNSTRTSPYPIQTYIGPDGREILYLADGDSIIDYGQSQRYVTFKNIAPISNSEPDKIAAADMLYDAAVAWLVRMKQPRRSYELSVIGLKDTLRAGDRLSVRYRGRVVRDGRVVDYAHLDEAMYLLRVSENFSLDTAGSASLDVSNVDAAPESIEETIVKTLNEVALRGLRPSTGTSTRSYPYPREIAPSYPAVVPIEITNATRDIIRVRVRIRTMPMRATSVQGPHRHVMFEKTGDPADQAITATLRVSSSEVSPIGAAFYVAGLWSVPNGTPFYTWGAGGGVEYGVRDDTATPVNISVWVDGIDRTTALGGPFALSGGNQNILLDEGLMTAYIANAAGGMYGNHTVEFRCASSHGRCEVTVEITEVIQSIDPR